MKVNGNDVIRRQAVIGGRNINAFLRNSFILRTVPLPVLVLFFFAGWKGAVVGFFIGMSQLFFIVWKFEKRNAGLRRRFKIDE